MLPNIQFGNACYELLHNHQRARIVTCSSNGQDAKRDLGRGAWSVRNLVYNTPTYDIKAGTRCHGTAMLASLAQPTHNGPSSAHGMASGASELW